MNKRMIFFVVGRIISAEAALLALPALVSLIYLEKAGWAFLVTIGICAAAGFGISAISRPKSNTIYAGEGFAIVALGWMLMSVLGALPFSISGEVGYIDALFETVSGFTTTGGSVIPDCGTLSRGLLFWRAFTHWIGGMGVLIFIMAIIPNLSDRSIHIMRAEVPGPVVGKLVPRVKDTAKILYTIYIALTAAEAIFLLCGGMSLFESIVHAFSTAGTGGFGVYADSVASYSPYIQWVLAVFMLLFGVNFNLYYLIVMRKIGTALKSFELWVYISIVLVFSGVIFVDLFCNCAAFADTCVGDTVRTAVFHVSSFLTTTGFSTADFNSWPSLSQGLLFITLFLGGCAGSTAGGLKLSRVILLFKLAGRELKHLVHPRSVNSVEFEGKAVDEQTLFSVSTYFSIYMVFIGGTFFLLGFDPHINDFKTCLTSAVSCFNNVGPIFGYAGANGGFADYSVFSKLVLSFAMLFGRLEIYPLLLALTPSTWTKR